MFIWRKIIHLCQYFRLHRSGRSGIQYHLYAIFMADINYILDGILGNLMLQQYDAACQQSILYAVHVFPVHPVIGSRHHHNRIVVIPYGNDRQTCVHSGSHFNVGGSHSHVLHVFYEASSGLIVAHTAEHLHIRPQLCHGNGLIGTLSSGYVADVLSFQRFPL